MDLNRISGAIIDSAMKVHTALGAGYWKAFMKLVWRTN
jgi:hypothetical protein